MTPQDGTSIDVLAQLECSLTNMSMHANGTMSGWDLRAHENGTFTATVYRLATVTGTADEVVQRLTAIAKESTAHE